MQGRPRRHGGPRHAHHLRGSNPDCSVAAIGAMIHPALLPEIVQMPTFLPTTFASLLLAGAALASAAAQPVPGDAKLDPKPDATLASRPETVIWGYITADLPPALTIKSG